MVNGCRFELENENLCFSLDYQWKSWFLSLKLNIPVNICMGKGAMKMEYNRDSSRYFEGMSFWIKGWFYVIYWSDSLYLWNDILTLERKDSLWLNFKREFENNTRMKNKECFFKDVEIENEWRKSWLLWNVRESEIHNQDYRRMSSFVILRTNSNVVVIDIWWYNGILCVSI